MAWPTKPGSGTVAASATMSAVIDALATWGGDVSAAGHNLTSLGALSFAPGGSISGAATVTVDGLLADPTLESGNWSAIRSSAAAGATKLLMGTTSGASYIQSMAQGTGWTTKPLILQSNGGQVGIGGSPVGSAKLSVIGDLNVTHLIFSSIRSATAATDSAAATAGCAIGELYRFNNAIYVRLT